VPEQSATLADSWSETAAQPRGGLIITAVRPSARSVERLDRNGTLIIDSLLLGEFSAMIIDADRQDA
jgi:hypothetical protein